MKKILIHLFLALALLLAFSAACLKLYRSERLRLWWNTPLYLHDGRHRLVADSSGVDMMTPGEFRVTTTNSRHYLRLIPRGGIDMEGEQSLSFTTKRTGTRTQFRLRPQSHDMALDDYLSRAHFPTGISWHLYFEQREYEGTNVLAYYKDAAYGPGGIFFVNPSTGTHVAHDNYSTLYVPTPTDSSDAGPDEWLWAAAANRAFVEARMTGTAARTAWDTRYCRRVDPPQHSTSPGHPGEIAWDDEYVYFYTAPETGWSRVCVSDQSW